MAIKYFFVAALTLTVWLAGSVVVAARTLQATEQETTALPAGVTSLLESSAIDMAATEALPSEYRAEGWARHSSGRCSYKGYQALDCPHGSGSVKFWQLLLANPGGRFHPVTPPPKCFPQGQTCSISDPGKCCPGLACCTVGGVATCNYPPRGGPSGNHQAPLAVCY